MAQTKNSPAKTAKTKSAAKEAEIENDPVELGDPKEKKTVDLESALEPAVIVDEKVDDEISVIGDDPEESGTDELSLDDDELNPFGDKWEQ